jgi:protein O-GlcNAc transferase
MMSDEPRQGNVRNDDAGATIAEAADLHQAGKLDEAARIYREILARSRYDFDANHLLGVIALQQGKFDIAQQLINVALALRPNDVAAVGNLGVSYLRDGQLEPALQWFELAVKLQPDSLAALTNLGETLYHLGRHRAAIPLLEKACAVDPSSYAAYNLLGACFLHVGDDHQAVKAFEEATRLRPEDAEAWANLSVASKAIGQDDRARDSADKAVRLHSESPAALDALSQAQFDQGRIAEAAENYRRGVPLVAPSVNMLLSYAYTLIANGLNDAAIQQLERARALDDKNLTVRWVLAIAQIKTIYESESEILESRKLFAKSLDEIESWYGSMPGIEAPDRAVGAVQPFWLAYHPYNNRDLLKRYGSLCATFMSKLPTREPDGREQNGDSPAGRKLRIGIVSSHISEHSIWTAVTRGWVHHLDRDGIFRQSCQKFPGLGGRHIQPTAGCHSLPRNRLRRADRQTRRVALGANSSRGVGPSRNERLTHHRSVSVSAGVRACRCSREQLLRKTHSVAQPRRIRRAARTAEYGSGFKIPETSGKSAFTALSGPTIQIYAPV